MYLPINIKMTKMVTWHVSHNVRPVIIYLLYIDCYVCVFFRSYMNYLHVFVCICVWAYEALCLKVTICLRRSITHFKVHNKVHNILYCIKRERGNIAFHTISLTRRPTAINIPVGNYQLCRGHIFKPYFVQKDAINFVFRFITTLLVNCSTRLTYFVRYNNGSSVRVFASKFSLAFAK